MLVSQFKCATAYELWWNYGIFRCILHTAIADHQMRSGENRQTQVTIYNSLPIGSAT